jgi:hypothetical protein
LALKNKLRDDDPWTETGDAINRFILNIILLYDWQLAHQICSIELFPPSHQQVGSAIQ